MTDYTTSSAPVPRIHITWVDHRASSTLHPEDLAWSDLVARLVHEVGEKDGLAFMPARFARIDDGRKGEHVAGLSCLALDVDHARAGEVKEILAKFPYRGVAYTTYRHTPEEPRFRLVFPFTREASPEEFRRIWRWAAGIAGADPACKDLSRLYYLPRVPDEESLRTAWVLALEGPTLDPDALLNELAALKEAPEPSSGPSSEGAAGSSSHPVSVVDGAPILEGARNSQLTSIAGAMRKWGLSKEEMLGALRLVNERCEPPLPDSEVEGIAASIARYDPDACPTQLAPTTSDTPWDPPVPLAATCGPPLPIDVLPDWFQRWTVETARATRTSPELAFLLGLAVISLAITRKVSVEVMSSWHEHANLYGCGVADVSEAKSPVFKAAMVPVVEWEAEERRRMAPIIAARTTEHEVLKKRREKAVGVASKPGADEAAMASAREAAEAVAGFDAPPLPQLVAEDATGEALGSLLVEQGERLGVFSAEGTPFEIAAGLYSNTPNPDVLLKAWSGDMLRVNRVTRDGGLCTMPLIACGVTVQPDVLARMGDVRALRARGFAARWLYVVPRPFVGSRPARSAPISDATMEGYRRRVRVLLDIPWPQTPSSLSLSTGAEEAFYAYRSELEPRLAPGEDLHAIRDWGAKTDRQVLRLAAVLHAADLAGSVSSLDELVFRPLPAATMERAVRLIRAFALHAGVAFGLMGTARSAGDARYLLDRIRDRGLPRLSRREIRRAARRFDRDEEMAPALQTLCEHGYVRLVDRTRHPGGSPYTETYEVHPSVLEAAEPRAKRADRSPPGAEDEQNGAFGTFGTPMPGGEYRSPDAPVPSDGRPEPADAEVEERPGG